MIMTPAEMVPFFAGLVAISVVGFLLQRRKK
jgi:LPXTG-motif cell wall-anchored protein